MKKSLVALAALAVAGIASAQSSVTLFGIVDASVSYYDAKADGVKQSQWALANSGYNSSRLGFRGTEDLGGGLAAGFWLEAPLANDNGNATGFTFQRRSTVSLSGGFGEIRLGRDYTPTFWNDTTFDPFGTNGVGTNVLHTAHATLGNPTQVRSSNTVGYFLPRNLGGFYGQLQYAFPENVKTNGASANKTNEYVGGRFGYANGPLDVALAYGQSTLADSAAVSEKLKQLNLGASYDLGAVKLFGELSQIKVKEATAFGSTEPTLNGALLGLTAPVGAGLIRASYSIVKTDLDLVGSDDPQAQKFAIGYVHNLSKRTAVYTTYAHIKGKNGAALTTGGSPAFAAGTSGSAKANGFDFGVRHSF